MPDMRLTGLVRNADLNGRLVALLDFTNGRWDVVLSDGTRLRVLPANLEPDEEGAQISLQNRGQPQTAPYLAYELGRQAGLSGVYNPRPATEQVTNKLKKGGGAVVTGLIEKESDDTEQALYTGDPEKFTTLESATWQLDILDYSRQDAIAGYGLVAVDVATRQVYGELMADKSALEARDAFARMIQDDDDQATSKEPLVPSMVDTDHDRAFAGAFRLYLERKNIAHRLKTDPRYSHNNLAMVDGVMGRIRSYIRKRLTEEAVEGQDNMRDWPEYFEEAVAAQSDRRYGVLSNMKRPSTPFSKSKRTWRRALPKTSRNRATSSAR